MLRQRGATEAKCALPKLRELPRDPTIADLGCGVGTITAFLAMSASNLCDGNVSLVGIDKDENSLAQAKSHCDQLNLTNVTFIAADVHDLSQEIPSNSVDLVYMNAVLMYSPKPFQVLDEIMRCLKPGGTAILRDLDPECGVWYPKEPLLGTWVELFDRAIGAMGGTLGISLQLPKLVEEAGFAGIEPFGENIRLTGSVLRTFSNQMAAITRGGLGKQWVAMNWCSEEEANAIAEAWSSFSNRDGAIVGHLWGGVIAEKPTVAVADK